MVKIEFTPLSLDRKIFPFKKGFKKHIRDLKISGGMGIGGGGAVLGAVLHRIALSLGTVLYCIC